MADVKYDTPGDRVLDVEEVRPLGLEAKPDGPGAAAMIAAGIGILVLGLLTVLAEASEPIHEWLETFEFDRGVGPLAGKTILASAGFFLSWLVFGIALRKKEVNLPRWFWASLILGVAGAILLFPPVFTSFAAD